MEEEGDFMSYTIGLIDDNDGQLADIRATIKENKSRDVSIDFKKYTIPTNSETAIDTLLKEIINDIKEECVQALIIDYKIVISTKNIDGTKIIKILKDNIPNFPVVVLTEIPDESRKKDYIDADKVYIKKNFLKLKDEYSKEKVNNIIDSIEKYVKQKDKLQTELDEAWKKESLKIDKSKAIQDIIEVEEMLSKYIPLEITQADRVINKDKISEIMTVIKQANDLLDK